MQAGAGAGVKLRDNPGIIGSVAEWSIAPVLKDCASGKRRERRVDLQGFFRSMASERGLQRLAKNAVS
jgi:hypothetical protein